MKQQLLNNRFIFFIILFLLLSKIPLEAKNDGTRYAQNSVLSTGNWIKIKIESTGVYKLTYNDLVNMGISNPKNVQVYGYGGEMIDEDFTKTYIDDLPQVAVWMSKPRADFGNGDYILFYGKGDIKWTYNQSRNEFEQTQNTYSFDSYYFITESEAGPLLMNETSSAGTASTVVTTFTDYYLHEKELINIGNTGREFYGENFLYTNSQNFNFNLPGITSDPVILRFNFISKLSSSESSANLEVKYNNKTLKRKKVSYTDNFADEINDTIITKNLTENTTINLTYAQGAGSSKIVRLNFLKLEYSRLLKPYGGVTLFRSKVREEQLGFKISGASDKLLIFDVTNSENPERIKANLSGTDMTFTSSNASIREYAMVNTASNDIPTPTVVGKVENQNLHSLEPKEMVIIVRPFLKKYAEQLAQIHKDDSGLESLIVTPEDIYNEFSSGKPDISAYRRFLKMFYDRNKDTAPQYLLLFGDGTYDNRFVVEAWTESQKKAMLLAYETTSTLIENSSLVTDDYVGFLDDDEAGVIPLSGSTLDIGVGRLPVRSEAEARAVVNKIQTYLTNKDVGFWKNNVAFYADDAIGGGGASAETMHCSDSNELADRMARNYPSFIVNKIYQDNYERIITANGARYPDAQKALLNRINSGVLVLNYMGHGSTRDWTHEAVLTLADVQKLNNKNWPLWITATCDYSRFDDYATSAGETVLLNPQGGAIALITTTRLVYASQNKPLNAAVLNHIFEKKDGKPLRLGDILRNAKKDINNINQLKFVLLGDPALRLSYPADTYKVKITEINGMDATDSNIKIEALANNKIKGVIVNQNDEIATDFTGKLESVIFDSELTLKTRGNKLESETSDVSITYKDYVNTIYSGTTNIVDGNFSIDFVTPADILYTDGAGKMSFLAYDNAGNEAQGSFLNYKVGGRYDNVEEDKNPPQIKIYLNKDDFKSGDKVNMTPMFYAEIYDDTGINLSTAIGHNISLTIDGLKSYNLTSNFVSKELEEGETGVLGMVNFSIPDLTEGKHSLQFRVWDVYNNSTTGSLDFECVTDYKPTIFKFAIEGNPAKESTSFVFYSDLSGSNIEVKYEVYSMTGALQWSHQETGIVTYASEYRYPWDLTTSNGARLQPGMYVCRINVSVDGKVKSSKSEKLIILEQ